MSATIGGRIRDLRYRRGMTQEELGEELIDGVELGGVATFIGSGETSDISLFI